MRLMFVRGVNDDNLLEPLLSPEGTLGLRIDGSSGVYRHMGFRDDTAESIVLFGDSAKQDSIKYQSKPSLVFNEITDPDSHKGALRRCVGFCEHLGVPVVNHPRTIQRTTRDNVSKLLQQIPGVTTPRTVRCTPRSPDEIYAVMKRENLGYPTIVRLAGKHGGTSSVLVRSNRDREKLHIYPFDGRDFYLTEYVDYQSDDGLYRKYRLVIVDGELFLRHILISDQWMVHASSYEFIRKHPDIWAERERRVENFYTNVAPKIEIPIRHIAKRMKLDYFGIDCNLDDDGNMLIFEANANMNILFNPRNASTNAINSIKDAITGLMVARERSQDGNGKGDI